MPPFGWAALVIRSQLDGPDASYDGFLVWITFGALALLSTLGGLVLAIVELVYARRDARSTTAGVAGVALAVVAPITWLVAWLIAITSAMDDLRPMLLP